MAVSIFTQAIVGVALLVASGCYAWRRYSASGNRDERQSAREAIAEAEISQEFKNIAEVLREWVFEVNEQLEISYLNPAARAALSDPEHRLRSGELLLEDILDEAFCRHLKAWMGDADRTSSSADYWSRVRDGRAMSGQSMLFRVLQPAAPAGHVWLWGCTPLPGAPAVIERSARQPVLAQESLPEFRCDGHARWRVETVSGALRAALDGESTGLQLRFRPLVKLSNRSVSDVECLPRWRYPGIGLIGQDYFRSIAARGGLMRRMTDWMLDAACRELARWRSEQLQVRFVVGVAAAEAADTRLAERVRRALGRYGLPPDCLEILLTDSETLIAPRYGNERKQLSMLRQAGVRVALDGVGMSRGSLVALGSLQLDRFWIAPELVSGGAERAALRAVVTALVASARQLGLECVAGGVESDDHLDVAVAARCTHAQGDFLYPELSSEDGRAVLRHSGSHLG